MEQPFPSRIRSVLFGLVLLAGCQTFPELDAAATARLSGDAVYPDIVPIGQVLAQAGNAAPEPADPAMLQARVAGLQGRAAALQGPVVDAETGARLQAATGG